MGGDDGHFEHPVPAQEATRVTSVDHAAQGATVSPASPGGVREVGSPGATRDLETLAEVTGRIRRNIERVIEGKPEVARLALVVLLAEGHLLIEDVPGVGKTMLSKTLARSIDCTVRRIQFTPDLLPSDVTGVSVFNQETRSFEFRPGGIFANIVVGDEINRASPKTQSALLECAWRSDRRQSTARRTTSMRPSW
jgi:MoxR-like ATPase